MSFGWNMFTDKSVFILNAKRTDMHIYINNISCFGSFTALGCIGFFSKLLLFLSIYFSKWLIVINHFLPCALACPGRLHVSPVALVVWFVVRQAVVHVVLFLLLDLQLQGGRNLTGQRRSKTCSGRKTRSGETSQSCRSVRGAQRVTSDLWRPPPGGWALCWTWSRCWVGLHGCWWGWQRRRRPAGEQTGSGGTERKRKSLKYTTGENRLENRKPRYCELHQQKIRDWKHWFTSRQTSCF